MNGVNDAAHASHARGEAADESSLAAVGVNDIGLARAILPRQLRGRFEVHPRMHGAYERGTNSQHARMRIELRLECAFGFAARSGNQLDLHAGLAEQTENGADGILLGAANDQPRDDMTDAHRRAHRANYLAALSSFTRASTVLRSCSSSPTALVGAYLR